MRLGADGVKTRSGLRTYLSKVLGVQVRIVAAASYTDLLDQVSRKEVHLAWASPALAVRACDELAAAPLASAVRAPGAQFYGTLFVRDGSAICTPGDLRGKKIAWVDKDSCSGYLFPRIALKAQGFELSTFFADERVLGSHDAVSRAVASGDADVGATYLKRDNSKGDDAAVQAGWSDVATQPMRSVLLTDSIPSDMVVASRELDAAWRAKILRVLTSMHTESDVAEHMRHLFGAYRFEAADLSRYDIVRAALEA